LEAGSIKGRKTGSDKLERESSEKSTYRSTGRLLKTTNTGVRAKRPKRENRKRASTTVKTSLEKSIVKKCRELKGSRALEDLNHIRTRRDERCPYMR